MSDKIHNRQILLDKNDFNKLVIVTAYYNKSRFSKDRQLSVEECLSTLLEIGFREYKDNDFRSF